MIVRKAWEAFHIRSVSTRVYIGSALVALAISLGTVWGAALFGVQLGAALPAALGAVAAATFAVSTR